jgi:hypothetical protein
MDITYNEVVTFLEIVRPGGERLVDELMIFEEMSGKELRSLAREYLSNLTALEILYNTRESSLFDLLGPNLKKSVSEIEKDTEDMIKTLNEVNANK